MGGSQMVAQRILGRQADVQGTVGTLVGRPVQVVQADVDLQLLSRRFLFAALGARNAVSRGHSSSLL